LTLTPAQRLAIFEALPSNVSGDEILVAEDDGGGWHHPDDTLSWVLWSVLDEGEPYSYEVGALLESKWNYDTHEFDDERGRLNKGVINLYICSIDKKKVQTYASVLSGLIERTRLSLSLDVEGITTGPDKSKTKPLGSYNDFRLKRRVYRTLIEIPVLYKFSEFDITPPIRRIGIQPYIGELQMGDELIARAPMLLTADIHLASDIHNSLGASLVLVLAE
jgi:hypothetical protein